MLGLALAFGAPPSDSSADDPRPIPEGPAPEGPRAPAAVRYDEVTVPPDATVGPSPARGAAPAPDVGDAAIEYDNDVVPGELGLVRSGDTDFQYVDPGGRFSATFHDDGTVTFADPWNRPDRAHPDRGRIGRRGYAGVPGLNPLAGIAMTGPTEWIMLAKGIDPSRSAKADLLDRTRALRTQLAIAWSRERIDERLAALDAELLALWADHERTREARRALLFERWDECDERFSVAPPDIPQLAMSEIDRYRLRAASEARTRIVRFVRRHLPPSSGHRYTKAELDQLNARRVSQDRFAPYP